MAVWAGAMKAVTAWIPGAGRKGIGITRTGSSPSMPHGQTAGSAKQSASPGQGNESTGSGALKLPAENQPWQSRQVWIRPWASARNQGLGLGRWEPVHVTGGAVLSHHWKCYRPVYTSQITCQKIISDLRACLNKPLQLHGTLGHEMGPRALKLTLSGPVSELL